MSALKKTLCSEAMHTKEGMTKSAPGTSAAVWNGCYKLLRIRARLRLACERLLSILPIRSGSELKLRAASYLAGVVGGSGIMLQRGSSSEL